MILNLTLLTLVLRLSFCIYRKSSSSHSTFPQKAAPDEKKVSILESFLYCTYTT